MPADSLASILSSNPPQLFLSYGRRDASALAERLHADLQARGFAVWQDTRKIRAGKAWEEEIRDALRRSRAVVALLSPHAVRRGIGPVDPDTLDSVCLDEISYARFATPPVPIVPVMASRCEPPFSIFRLDYVDMTEALNSEERYQAGLARLVEGVEAALRGERPAFRRWHRTLPAIDFSSYLNDKRRDFVGRRWLMERVDAWRASAGRERALLITGDPGVGKSAFVAELVFRNPGGQVLAHHCCIADNRETLEPGAFVVSLAAALASRVPEYADAVEAPRMQEILSPAAAVAHPGRALDEGVLAVLDRIAPSVKDRRLVLIDALDEALTVGDANIVTLLAPRLDQFPAWLRVVATTRREQEVMDRLSGLRAASIEAQQDENLADVDEYVRLRLGEPELAVRLRESSRTAEEVQHALREAGAGNFLYVKTVLQDVERDLLSFARLDEFPRGLSGVYRSFFDRKFSKEEGGYGAARAVLEVIVSAQAPPSVALLEQVSGLDPDYELPKVLDVLSPFLLARDGRYAVYHKSLTDWLTDRECPYRASPARGDRRFADAFLRFLAQPRPTVIPADVDPVLAYWARYGLVHLAQCNDTLPLGTSLECIVTVFLSVPAGVALVGSATELPQFVALYVHTLVQAGQSADLLLLVRAFQRTAMLAYVASELAVEIEPVAGRHQYQVTPPAKRPAALHKALAFSGGAGAIVRAVLDANTGDAETITSMMAELDILRYWAGGLDIAGWAYGLSGFFEDAGYMIYKELSRIKERVEKEK